MTYTLHIQLAEQCSSVLLSLNGFDFPEHGVDCGFYPGVLQLSEDGIEKAVSSTIHSSSKFQGKTQSSPKTVDLNLIVVGKCTEMVMQIDLRLEHV